MDIQGLEQRTDRDLLVVTLFEHLNRLPPPFRNLFLDEQRPCPLLNLSKSSESKLVMNNNDDNSNGSERYQIMVMMTMVMMKRRIVFFLVSAHVRMMIGIELVGR